MRLFYNIIGFCFFIAVIFFAGAVYAQEFHPKFRQYNNAEGLSQSVVLSIFQDSKNFLWIGTEDGLNKFDGNTFKVYRYDPEDSSSISDNWIEKILLEDSDGNIWLVTSDRTINVFNPRTERFTKISPSTNKDGLLPFQRLVFIREDSSGLFWISTDKGLFITDKKGSKVNHVYINNNHKDKPRIFRSMRVDGNNKVWIGSNEGVLVWNNKKNNNKIVTIDKLSDKAIQGIEVVNDTTWIVTENEIFGYSNTTGTLKVFPYKHLLASKFADDISKMRKGLFALVKRDSENNLWICSQQGLVQFNLKTYKLCSYLNNSSDKRTISSNNVTAFYEDKLGNKWFGTDKGLNKFLPDNNSFIRYGMDVDNHTNSTITLVFEDKTGRLWAKNQKFQNEGSALFYIDERARKLTQVKNNIHDFESLPLDLVYDPFIDHQGNIWFGTYGSGVLLYAPQQKKFDLIRHKPGNSGSLAGNSSWAISEDARGRLWIALFQDGLDCYDPATGKTIHFKEKIGSFIGTKNFTIVSVLCDNNNNVWFGTIGQGLVCMNIETGRMDRYQNDAGTKNHISSNYILAITKGPSGNLLISLPDSGLDVLDINKGMLTNYKSVAGNNNTLLNNSVRYALETSEGNYWISCDGVITFFNRKENKMTHYLTRKTSGQGILSNKASCIFEDSKGNIWIGTHGGGLSLFNKQKNEFKYWVEKNGLINNVVYGILEDKESRLWISTNNGISCFNPSTTKFTNYYVHDGLQGSEFNANSFYKDKKGRMYFGGMNGVTAFYPDDIHQDLVPPRLAITGLQIFNKKVEVLPFEKRSLVNGNNQVIEIGDHFYLPEVIPYTRKLLLNYNYKVFTFEFTALRFDMPERCTFMYKMEGFEKDWNIAGHRRFATYTNLPPGHYVFKVTAANADGIWNPEPVKIEIEIKPPFYLTWWFVTLAVTLLVVGAAAFIRRRERSLKKAKTLLEAKVKLRTHELNEKNEELTLRNAQIIKQKEEIARQAKRLRVELDLQNQTSEQALLRSQINPHFLFNTLNNIYALVYQKAASAPESIMKLSEIMRYMLYDTSADRVLLEKEIQYLNSFIELQLLRLKNRDFVSFEVLGDPSGKQIAPMLLIPFVENAFKHGNKSAPSPGIDIKLDCSSDNISFKVKNSKNKSAVKDSYGGIGLANVKRRLELIYHEKYKLNIVDAEEKFNIDLEIKTDKV